MQEWASLISTTGFPIAVACYVLCYSLKTARDREIAYNNLTSTIIDQVKKNTEALAKVAVYMEIGEDEDNGNK